MVVSAQFSTSSFGIEGQWCRKVSATSAACCRLPGFPLLVLSFLYRLRLTALLSNDGTSSQGSNYNCIAVLLLSWGELLSSKTEKNLGPL